MRELFIYYRVSASNAAAALAAVQAFQARVVEAHPQLGARLLRRPETSAEGLETWMETYAAFPLQDAENPGANDDTGVTPAIEADIARRALDLAPHIVGTRHTEVFVACA